MTPIAFEQALFHRRGTDAPALVSRSAKFRDTWIDAAEGLIDGFGTRPIGVACPLAVFARPLDRRHVALVRVADQDGPGMMPTGGDRPAAGLGFHVLVLPRTVYER